MEVSVYSSCDQVELFLNGKSLGKRKQAGITKFMATWHVPYHPGILKAIGYTKESKWPHRNCKLQNKFQRLNCLRTFNDQSRWPRLKLYTVELTDANGIRNPKAENLVKFKVEGGTIVGVGNANPSKFRKLSIATT